MAEFKVCCSMFYAAWCMKVGIDASRAFLPQRTGIEEYSYRVIRHLRDWVEPDDEVVLYVRKQLGFRNGRPGIFMPSIDFDLPERWRVRGIWAPRFWTQLGLSLEMLIHRPDALFIPAHTVPLIHPQQTIVTIHGLEYEFSPESYAWWERMYMRWSIRFSAWAASQVIAVSENTKQDLVRLYRVPEEKVEVIYEGVERSKDDGRSLLDANESPSNRPSLLNRLPQDFFLFIGRLETRKNVKGIIQAYELFKQRTGLPQHLVLAGKPGYGYVAIRQQISDSRYQGEIHELGYVNEEAKRELLRRATAFVFPSLYEGFGLPVIEAQLAGTPVITSTTSSLPEIVGEGALLVHPIATKKLARALAVLATDTRQRADIIAKATRNADRFSWARCARGVVKLLKP